MAGREGPEPGVAEKNRAIVLGRVARAVGLGVVPVLLFCVLPFAACRMTCVPYRDLCEAARGEYTQSFAFGHECDMDEPVDATHPCPPGYVHRPGSLTNCDGEDVLPLATVSPLWR